MTSELIGVTRYKLSISIDAAATPPKPPPSAGAGERFFSITAKYLHLIPHSLLPPGQPASLHRSFIVPRDGFLALGPESVRRLIISGMGLRALPDDSAFARFAPIMSRFAADVDADPYRSAAVVSVVMSLTAVTFPQPEDVDRALRESAAEVRTVRASKSSVEALEIVATIEAQGRCSICLDDFEHHDQDRTVAKMPCSHQYHRGCIVQWLENSHSCPLCRFAMPTD